MGYFSSIQFSGEDTTSTGWLYQEDSSKLTSLSLYKETWKILPRAASFVFLNLKLQIQYNCSLLPPSATQNHQFLVYA